jgi:hypothetical protein
MFNLVCENISALQRHNTEIQRKYTQKKGIKLGLSPNFRIHSHVSVSDLYIPTIGLPVLPQENMWNVPRNI